MSLIKKNSDLWKRLRFYGFGFLMGCLLVSAITKGKACRMPSTVKLEELSTQSIEYSQHAICRMQCRNITEAEVNQVLKNGKINYGKSEVHGKPFPTFAVEGNSDKGQHLRIIVADRDTMSRIVTAIDLSAEKDSCSCP
jgi:hypothetical protein